MKFNFENLQAYEYRDDVIGDLRVSGSVIYSETTEFNLDDNKLQTTVDLWRYMN